MPRPVAGCASEQGRSARWRRCAGWVRLAADQGDAEAQFNLGIAYANGQGVLKDEAEAVRWFRLAAEQGDAMAQFNLGIMYANGQGVLKDDAEAVKWFRLAAEQGYAQRSSASGSCIPRVRVSLGPCAGCEWPSSKGLLRAEPPRFMYSRGRGVLKDDAEAVKWYRLAAEQGTTRRAVQPRDHVRQRARVSSRTMSKRCAGTAWPPSRDYAEAQYNLGRQLRLRTGCPQGRC